MVKMQVPQKTVDLRKTIKKSLSEIDIAWYIYEEVCYMLDHLNYYKLQNIKKNQDEFFAYLCELDDENTILMKQLVQ